MEIIAFALPFVVAIFLLIFFRKETTWQEYILLIVPSILVFIITRLIMISVRVAVPAPRSVQRDASSSSLRSPHRFPLRFKIHAQSKMRCEEKNPQRRDLHSCARRNLYRGRPRNILSQR